MTKNFTIFVIVVALIAIVMLAFSSQLNSTVQTSAQSKLPEVPDYIVYRHLFRHVAAFKAKADEMERQGVDATAFHNFFKQKAKLSNDEAQKLERTASQFARSVKAIDERAEPIIRAYKANYPNGQVPHGQPPLPPPAELRQLTAERNELVLRKRDELRSAFGEEAFGRFQDFVKNKIAPNVDTVSSEQ